LNRSRDIFRILIVAVLVGSAAFVLARGLSSSPEPKNELTWLVQEFELTESQAAEVSALHAAFKPICEQHCDAIHSAQQDLMAARNEAERTAAMARLTELERVCHDATRAHLEQVAAFMRPDQRKRYLAMIEPRLSAYRHGAPFGLR